MDTIELNELATSLRAAAKAYYDTDEPIMSDAEYDAGIDRLAAAARADTNLAASFSDLLTEVAGGQSAGGDVTHPVPMKSLDKVTELSQATEFVSTITGPVVVEPKLDGMALRVVYESGRLALVATRGNGTTGEDVTRQARRIGLVPFEVPGLGSVELRGEAYLTDSHFKTASRRRMKAGGEAFVNPRNAAAGILRRGDEDMYRLLSFAVYEVIAEADSHTERLHATVAGVFLDAGSLVPEINHMSWQDAIAHLAERRAGLGFPIDGAVIKADLDSDRERLGETGRAPRWAAAFKFEADSATTTVTGITTEVGRTGRMGIRIEIEPVFLGSKITYASGHNVMWMADQDIRIGDTVTVERRGDVIPYVSGVDLSKRPEGSTPWTPPATDPGGTPWDKTTDLWRSTDPTLSLGAALLYATSRDALDIEGVGAEIADALVDHGYIHFTDLFRLDAQRLAGITLANGQQIGLKTAAKIVAEVDKARSAPWARVITALGMRGTGRSMSRRLARAFPNIGALASASSHDLMTVEGVGAIKAGTIRAELNRLMPVLDQIVAEGITTGEEATEAPSPLEGMTIVVSGTVPGYTRTTIREFIESLGGKTSGSVSKNTSLLVSEPSTSSKYVKAVELGVQIVTPAEFLEMCE